MRSVTEALRQWRAIALERAANQPPGERLAIIKNTITYKLACAIEARRSRGREPVVAVALGETLSPLQYGAVALVIGGCIGLAYQPADAANKVTGRAWIPLAFSALVLWGGAQTIVKYDYSLGATDVNMALYSMIGALPTLGIYGLWKGRAGTHSVIEWTRSFLPMGMMASGDLGVLIASRYGKISIVTPLTGAYPLVTLAFAALVLRERIILLQWGCIAGILVGMYFCTS